MASDSRLTLNTEQRDAQGKSIGNVSMAMTDSNYKTFLAFDRIGISTFGQADIKGVPIAGYIESFIMQEKDEKSKTVEQIATDLRDYFKNIQTGIQTGFHVAGYDEDGGRWTQKLFRVSMGDGVVRLLNPPNNNNEIQGSSWDGESDIMTRILQPVMLKDQAGNMQQLPHFVIPWQFFTLQDSIDFAVYATRTTTDSLRFMPRPKTVGGPIDVLVIKPGQAFWVARKGLKVE